MVLVTGGTGLLGSHLLHALCVTGCNVRAIYRDEERISAVTAVFAHYSPNDYLALLEKIEWVKGDVLDVVSLADALEHVTQVYHCAALVSFEKKDFFRLMQINREGTANVVNACLDFGVSKLCYISSTAAIGGENFSTITETTKWKQGPSTSGYSIAKYSAEKEVWRAAEEGLDVVVLNPSVIFGAGNWEESSLKIFRTVKNGLRFYTSGANGFVDARDVAEIALRLMQSEIKNERFLCVGVNCSFKELLTTIALQMNLNPPGISTPRWLAEIGWRLAWISGKWQSKSATLTKESVASSFGVKRYDNSKVVDAISVQFRDLSEMVSNTIRGKIR
jgi:nucleoside-diphosphate-sugar epimerase